MSKIPWIDFCVQLCKIEMHIISTIIDVCVRWWAPICTGHIVTIFAGLTFPLGGAHAHVYIRITMVMVHVQTCGKINSINIHCKWRTQGQTMHRDIKIYSISVIPLTLCWPQETKVPFPFLAPCTTSFQLINVLTYFSSCLLYSQKCWKISALERSRCCHLYSLLCDC